MACGRTDCNALLNVYVLPVLFFCLQLAGGEGLLSPVHEAGHWSDRIRPPGGQGVQHQDGFQRDGNQTWSPHRQPLQVCVCVVCLCACACVCIGLYKPACVRVAIWDFLLLKVNHGRYSRYVEVLYSLLLSDSSGTRQICDLAWVLTNSTIDLI